MSKEINGAKLFRRKYGFSSSVIPAGQIGLMTMAVPYANAKINELEIINGREGDSIDLKILDTTTGAVTGYPNYLLNQFGFDVYLPNGFYRDVSNYDASVFYGLQIEIVYKNNGLEDVKVYGNVIYHELV
jgi:hypothetical protein